MNNLGKLLDVLFKNLNIYFYTIDFLMKKIVIFTGDKVYEISLIKSENYYKKTKYFYFLYNDLVSICEIYKFVNKEETGVINIDSLIDIFIMYEEKIHELFSDEIEKFYSKTFNPVKTDKKILLILKGGGMEENIEKSFIAYCNYSKLNLTVLYKFGNGYWGQKIDQSHLFRELKALNEDVDFIYNEEFDDEYIDSLIDGNTEVFSFQYDYVGKHAKLNLLVLSSVVDNKDIDCNKYKNIFSCYNSNSIGYSTDKFINTDNTKIYKFFNPQNISLLKNFSIIKNIGNFLLSGGMSWCRDFSILNTLKGKYKGILISDEIHDIKNFIGFYRGIKNYYGFFGAFKLSQIGVFCHLDNYNDDDRSKMIATSICSGKPVIVPYNDGLIIKTILDNKLGLAYKNGDGEDMENKIKFFTENIDNLNQYSENCKLYSDEHMDVNKYIDFIFNKIFNK